MKRSVSPDPGSEATVVGDRHGLQCSRRRRADRDDPATFVERAVDVRRRRVGDLVALWLEPMIFDAFDADRLKRAVADVQRDLDDDDAAVGKRRHQRIR